MTIPVWFQDWYNNGSGGIAAAAQVYIDRVEADGGTVESIGCVPSTVWDWTASTFTGVLDVLPAAQFGVSYRRLTGNYSGNCSQVIRSSDLTSQDIGFVANVEDTASLLSFVGANDGFRSEWYDQSGNIRDASQATAASRPRIVSSGTLDTLGGDIAPYFDGTDDFIGLASDLNVGSVQTMAFKVKFDGTSNIVSRSNGANYILIQGTNTIRYANGDFNLRWEAVDGVPNITIGERTIVFVRDGDTVTLYVDGVSCGSKTGGTGATGLFRNIGSSLGTPLLGNMKEFIVWTEALTPTQVSTYVSF